MRTQHDPWKRSFLLAGTLLLAGMLFPASTFAQQGRGSGGWGANSSYNRLYDPATVETLRGTVERVDRFAAQRGGTYGIHVLLSTGEETVPVHLGPGWYIENQEAQIRKGDELEVTGSRITFEGRPALIAAEVKRGSEAFRLRDRNGFPAWHGWRRQR